MTTILRSHAGETLEFEVGPIDRDDPPVEILSSAGTTFTTVANHGYTTGNWVRIEGHLGNRLNGVWVVTVLTATTFALNGASSSESGGRTGTVTRIVPVDLALASTAIVFSAKRRIEEVDGDAVVSKQATLNSPSTERRNRATVTINPADTDDILLSEDLYFDVQLTEPGGRVTQIDHGIWKVAAAVTRA